MLEHHTVACDRLATVRQALSYACSQWASLPPEEVLELPPDLLLALLGNESLEVRRDARTQNTTPENSQDIWGSGFA